MPRCKLKKTCTKCGLEKDLDQFHRSTKSADGRKSYCSDCKSKYDSSLRFLPDPNITHKLCSRCGEEKLVDDFHLNRKHKTGLNSHCKQCHWEDQELKLYGVTRRRVVEVCGTTCMICWSKEATCIDHIRGTKIIRGYLCDSCNKALGFFYDSKSTIELALNYLDSPPAFVNGERHG